MYDPRWDDDPRSLDDNARDLSRGSRGGSDPRERERPDPRDVFMDHVDLPRGVEREHVHHHGHDYTLRGSETRTLTSVGAFRVARADDLRDTFDKPLDPRHGELWHLRKSGLVQTVRIDRDTTVVALTKEGRDLLEARRTSDDPRERIFVIAPVRAVVGMGRERPVDHRQRHAVAMIQDTGPSRGTTRTASSAGPRTSSIGGLHRRSPRPTTPRPRRESRRIRPCRPARWRH
jgi:hypothetical protein